MRTLFSIMLFFMLQSFMAKISFVPMRFIEKFIREPHGAIVSINNENFCNFKLNFSQPSYKFLFFFSSSLFFFVILCETTSFFFSMPNFNKSELLNY